MNVARHLSLVLFLSGVACHGSRNLEVADGGGRAVDSSALLMDAATVVDAGAGGGGAGGIGGTGGSAAGGTGGSTYGGGCPSSPPVQGTACPREPLVCEYGDDPRTRCHTLAECSVSRTWNVIPPNCDPIPPAACPATREEASGKDCATMDAVCAYSGLACTCTNCIEHPIVVCNGPRVWKCDAPSPDPGCPHAPGVLGTTCKPEGLACRYKCDLGRACKGGIWVDEQVGSTCPISLRSAKRDIRYVSDHDRARLAADLERVRLATYRYVDPANGEGRRLGFIIDDSPDLAAVDAARGRVDLYAYTSMVVAALQEQAREIAALRREIARLKKSRR
jgi:hypothetical protein